MLSWLRDHPENAGGAQPVHNEFYAKNYVTRHLPAFGLSLLSQRRREVRAFCCIPPSVPIPYVDTRDHNAPNTPIFCRILFRTLPSSYSTASSLSRTVGAAKLNATISALSFAVDVCLPCSGNALALLLALADDYDRVVDDFGFGRCFVAEMLECTEYR